MNAYSEHFSTVTHTEIYHMMSGRQCVIDRRSIKSGAAYIYRISEFLKTIVNDNGLFLLYLFHIT